MGSITLALAAFLSGADIVEKGDIESSFMELLHFDEIEGGVLNYENKTGEE